MNLTQIVEYWDKYLKDWDRSPNTKVAQERSNGYYFISTASPLLPYISYLPEPYYGSISSDTKKLCVILDLNPGLSHPNDTLKIHGATGASLYNAFHASSYSIFNERYSPFLPVSIDTIDKPNEIPGAKWWKEKRMKWVLSFYKRFHNHGWSYHYFPPLISPLVFELCPWHSKRWSNGIVSGMNSYLIDKVFEPAAEAIVKSGLPFAFCFGKISGDILLKCGFHVRKEWSHVYPTMNWPSSPKTNLPVKRTYRLLEGSIINQEKTYFLNLYANGSFGTPSSLFSQNVEPDIINWLKNNI